MVIDVYALALTLAFRQDVIIHSDSYALGELWLASVGLFSPMLSTEDVDRKHANR